jgi:hypothetical protein
MPYDQHCIECPYFNQKHLPPNQQTTRSSPPVELEANGSNTLLVFQAPGNIEWDKGLAIQPTKKKGGSGGARIAQSWQRSGKQRTDFDIINAVQCFPGIFGERDDPPSPQAKACCAKRLKAVLLVGNYLKVIPFGDVARETLNSLLKETGQAPTVPTIRHPNGAVEKSDLDAVW